MYKNLVNNGIMGETTISTGDLTGFLNHEPYHPCITTSVRYLKCRNPEPYKAILGGWVFPLYKPYIQLIYRGRPPF